MVGFMFLDFPRYGRACELGRTHPANDRKNMTQERILPPGQHEIDEFPRFGLTQFAHRFPEEAHHIKLQITGDVEPITISDELQSLVRVDQISDFHCVTTWSRRAVSWSGFRFSDFFEKIIVPRARPQPDIHYVFFRGQDGYATGLPLADLLAENVLLADRLNGEPLSIEHGAPLRLVAPAHYGYKNPKHLCAVEFWCNDRQYPSSTPFRFMAHPRARVALEERGTGVPGWLLRYLYRPLVRPTIRQFRQALNQHLNKIP